MDQNNKTRRHTLKKIGEEEPILKKPKKQKVEYKKIPSLEELKKKPSKNTKSKEKPIVEEKKEKIAKEVKKDVIKAKAEPKRVIKKEEKPKEEKKVEQKQIDKVNEEPVLETKKASKKEKVIEETKEVAKKPQKKAKKQEETPKQEAKVEEEKLEVKPKTKKKAKKVVENKKEEPKKKTRVRKKTAREKKIDSLIGFSDINSDLDFDFDDEPKRKKFSFKRRKYGYLSSKDKKLRILFILNVVLILCLGIVGFLYFKGGLNFSIGSINSPEREVMRNLPEEADPTFEETYKEFYEKAFVKDDYVGQIIFESGIINEPVLQGDTNETYLRRNYETYKYEVCGPVFMDYICDRESDQNLILYGHNRSTGVDPEHIMMFSPLHVLEKQENYDENKLIYLALADRVDVYLVAAVYPVKVVEKEDGNQYLVKGEPKYYLDNYGVEEFELYYEGVKQRQLYETGVKLVNTDELLTLQTCYEGKLDKLIILAKKIDSMEYKKP